MFELKRLGAVLNVSQEGSLMAQLRVKSGYREQLLEAQQLDDEVLKVRIKLESGGETLRGFTKGMCFGISWKLGGAPVTSRIHV
jgi:hypothetical protein